MLQAPNPKKIFAGFAGKTCLRHVFDRSLRSRSPHLWHSQARTPTTTAPRPRGSATQLASSQQPRVSPRRLDTPTRTKDCIGSTIPTPRDLPSHISLLPSRTMASVSPHSKPDPTHPSNPNNHPDNPLKPNVQLGVCPSPPTGGYILPSFYVVTLLCQFR